MLVFDEITKKFVGEDKTKRVVIEYYNDIPIYGYVTEFINIYPVLHYQSNNFESKLDVFFSEENKQKLIYSNLRGCYLYKNTYPKHQLIREINVLGTGLFPYHFQKRYEACESFNIFNGRQHIIKDNKYNFNLDYTFGLEFETSAGYIPEDICFRDGLIPLRDGSITGLEYSTVVLKGNDGLNLLKQQLDSLKKYTIVNKDCSLHIHIGNFNNCPKVLYRLYTIFKTIEPDIANLYCPPYTFNTEKYKSNGKSYCKKLPRFHSFNNMYECLVGVPYFGSLLQAHPKDIERKAKWNIHTRYYALNFINALCYNVNKTVEFRFLRPSFSFEKIVLWLQILGGLVKLAESNISLDGLYTLEDVMRVTYNDNPKLLENIIAGLDKLYCLRELQVNNGDLFGDTVNFEQRFFN